MQQTRTEIDALIAAGDARSAAGRLAELWRAEPGSSTAAFVAGRFEKLRGAWPMTASRLAILRSFTVEPLVPLLRAGAFTGGIDLTVQLGEFNAWQQEMLDPGSALYRFDPQVVILAVETRTVAPGLWSGREVDAAAQTAVIRGFENSVRVFREHSKAHLILHGLEQPALAASGLLDAQAAEGQRSAIERVNEGLRALARSYRGVYYLDYDALVARHGRVAWHDERKWLTVRMPIAAPHMQEMTREWLKFLHPIAGRVAKCLVLDLDNTVWGGVIGEDGMTGIKLGAEYPGAAFQALQQAALDLTQRGIVLAVASKNNPDDALEAIRTHPGMILREEHFAALRINWNPKAQSLRELAAELNIGIDALAFFDDNPVERAHVRDAAPEVSVIEVPADPMQYARTLLECPLFERLTISEEDRQRTGYYAAERQRTELETSFISREDFYRSLEQEAEIAPVAPMTLARVAQLTQKTNQFNLTTRRYSEQEISAHAAAPGGAVWSIRVSDRYGDNGLVGVAVTSTEGTVCTIDALLMSCRVIGRTVETALLAHLVSQARTAGATRLTGWFLPTRKNAPAREFYREHGFQPAEEKDGGTRWELDLTASDVAWPEWVRRPQLVAQS